MKRKPISIGVLAYASSTLLIAFLFGAFAAWAYSRLEPSARDVISAAGASWLPAQDVGREADASAPRTDQHIDPLVLPSLGRVSASVHAD